MTHKRPSLYHVIYICTCYVRVFWRIPDHINKYFALTPPEYFVTYLKNHLPLEIWRNFIRKCPGTMFNTNSFKKRMWQMCEACEKIPEFSSLSWDIPAGFFCPFFSNFYFIFPKDFLKSNNTFPKSTFLCQVLRK